MISHPIYLRAAALAGLGVFLSLSAATAFGASVTLTGPEHGATIPTTSRTTSAILSWQADATGCESSLVSAIPVISGPIPIAGQSVVGAPPSGANVLTFVNSKPNRSFSWHVSMDCPGVGTVVSETREFTIQGADPNPRLTGRHRVVWGSTPQTWTFTPLCRTGACTTRVKIRQVPPFLLKFDPRTRTYSARVVGDKAAKAAVCTDKETGKQFRNAYTGLFRLDLAVKTTMVVGVNTVAKTLTGRMTGRYTPTDRGEALRCPAFRANDPVRGTKG